MKATDVLGCLGGAAFLLLASAWIPFIGPFLSLLTPLPFLYYSTRLGLYEGIKLSAVVVFAIGITAHFAGRSQMILFALEFSLIGLGLSELFRRNFSLGQTVFWGTVLMSLLGLASLFFIGLTRNLGPIEVILDYLQAELNTTLKAYEAANTGNENALELDRYVRAFMATLSKIYPSLMILGTGFALWLNIIIAKPLFRIKGLTYPEFIPMDRWKAPDHLIWGVIISGFALFFSLKHIQFLAINTLIVILAIYLFHGLSIILFFLNKYHVPSWIRIGIYFLIMIQQIFLAVLTLAGLFDQWIDFRKIHKRVES
ncbi:MAG: YybS family protein [Desulfatiglandaceae bacterium]